MARCWRRVAVGCAIAGAILVSAAIVTKPADTHAVVTKATLVEKSVAANTPTLVTIHFDGRIEPGFTRVILVDETKRERPLGVTSSLNGDTVTIDLPALAPGMYALRYAAPGQS